jgi:hypothetical protein
MKPEDCVCRRNLPFRIRRQNVMRTHRLLLGG